MNSPPQAFVVAPAALQNLLDTLAADGYAVIGPTVRDAAVVFEPVESVSQLPVGVADEQSGGRYRLIDAGRPALFDYVVGPQSPKRWLYPPRQRLWQAVADGDGFRVEVDTEPAPRYALLGLRPCELRALQLQDKVFEDGPFSDNGYQARRGEALVVAVNCGRPAQTCFCSSQGCGPGLDAQSARAADLAITELFSKAPGDDAHSLLIEAHSMAGQALLEQLPGRDAKPQERAAAGAVTDAAAAAISRHMNDDAAALLERNPEHPHWADVAARCLSCGNCTLVCPTCFCSTTEDTTSLDGQQAARWRQWDSCFSEAFSYIHGGSIRRSGESRYRQWITHKLAHWHQQFDSSGCVGCGRCITWCPVGIDITEEVAAIAANPAAL